jgi:chemotaxis protein methyltransferase CheR
MTMIWPSPPLAEPTPEAFAEIAEIAEAEAGLFIAPGKVSMVQSRLSGRLRALGLADYEDYLRVLHGEAGHAERRRMISALTTNVTQFFREMHHFDLLSRDVLPGLIAHARQGGRVRVWSAGCATGQEALSIAMTILLLAPDAADLNIRVLATDIDQVVIAQARQGLCYLAALSEIPPAYRERFATVCAGVPRLTDAPAQLVRFQELNLHGTWPMTGRFDVIFCRNVTIYFTPGRQAALWPRFGAALCPDGWLFVGHSERVPTDVGSPFTPAGITTYRLREATSSPARRPPVQPWR